MDLSREYRRAEKSAGKERHLLTFWRAIAVFVTMGVVGLLLGAEPLHTRADSLSESPLRAAAIGIDVRATQWRAFALAGAFAGLAGGLYALQRKQAAADPDKRYKTEALAKARALAPELGLGAADMLKVRNQAISCFTLVDLRIENPLDLPHLDGPRIL